MLLWRNKKHRASLTKLEHVVWKHKEKGEKRIEEVKTERGIERVNVASTFIDPNKIMSHIHYINNKLEESSFPYKIVSVNDRSRKLKGYRLKIRKQLAKKTNKNQQNISDLIHKICSK
jgi:hypothetical protein